MQHGKSPEAHSLRRHYRKLLRQAEHIKAICQECSGSGTDFAGDDCWRCNGSGKSETPAWSAFLLLRGAPLWLVNGETHPAE